MTLDADLAALEADGIEMEYEGRDGTRVQAIANVSLRIAIGEFVTIVGPSGCGKTTLLKIANGLLTPTSGRILVHGRPSSSSNRERAMVFQEASLFPWYTVARNVGYGLECQGLPRDAIRQRVAPLLELVGLSGFEHRYPHELSGGMQQRVNLARALVVDPTVLLMDEPFASLDAQTREVMQGELLDIWGQTRKTVLFITHQIDEAVYLSDRVIVMSARPGRILADIRIEVPRPRPLTKKHSELFRKYHDEVWNLIERQVRVSMDQSRLADLSMDPRS
jgi:NitT/TauT family transport system ATP-binding protein